MLAILLCLIAEDGIIVDNKSYFPTIGLKKYSHVRSVEKIQKLKIIFSIIINIILLWNIIYYSLHYVV